MRRNDAAVYIRLPKEVVLELDRIAKADERSRSALIRLILKQHVRAYIEKEKSPLI